LASAVVLFSVTITQGDDIKVKGLWYRNATIDKFEGGKIHFTPAGGRVVKADIRNLEVLKIKTLPELEDAEERFEDGNYNAAFKAYQLLRNKARQKWLKQWVEYRIVKCADRMGLADQSISAYLNLAKLEPDEFFMRNQPDGSLASVTKVQKKQFLERVNNTIKRVRNSKVKAKLRTLKETLESLNVDPPTTTKNGKTNGGTKHIPQVKTDLPKRPKSATLFIRELDKPEYDGVEARSMLRRGAYPQVLGWVDKQMKRRDSDMSLVLYCKGMAQLAQAEAAASPTDKELKYKNAGISFMQVAILFPKSVWAGHAQMEAGYIHMKIGRKDLVKQLYNKAGVYLDPEEEPEVADRLDRLIEELNKSK